MESNERFPHPHSLGYDGREIISKQNGGDRLAYAPSGFIWEDALRAGKTVRIFGEYASQFNRGIRVLFGPWADWYKDSQILEGKAVGRLHVPVGFFSAWSDVPSVQKNLNTDYPIFDTDVPDQYRVDIFLDEFSRHVANHDLQDLTILTLCDDHASGVAPGYPTARAQVADNDLALGRGVDAISNSPYWKDSAIFVVEDDLGLEPDHVDGHRSSVFVISPYSRRGQVDHTCYTQIRGADNRANSRIASNEPEGSGRDDYVYRVHRQSRF